MEEHLWSKIKICEDIPSSMGVEGLETEINFSKLLIIIMRRCRGGTRVASRCPASCFAMSFTPNNNIGKNRVLLTMQI